MKTILRIILALSVLNADPAWAAGIHTAFTMNASAENFGTNPGPFSSCAFSGRSAFSGQANFLEASKSTTARVIVTTLLLTTFSTSFLITSRISAHGQDTQSSGDADRKAENKNLQNQLDSALSKLSSDAKNKVNSMQARKGRYGNPYDEQKDLLQRQLDRANTLAESAPAVPKVSKTPKKETPKKDLAPEKKPEVTHPPKPEHVAAPVIHDTNEESIRKRNARHDEQVDQSAPTIRIRKPTEGTPTTPGPSKIKEIKKEIKKNLPKGGPIIGKEAPTHPISSQTPGISNLKKNKKDTAHSSKVPLTSNESNSSHGAAKSIEEKNSDELRFFSPFFVGLFLVPFLLMIPYVLIAKITSKKLQMKLATKPVSTLTDPIVRLNEVAWRNLGALYILHLANAGVFRVIEHLPHVSLPLLDVIYAASFFIQSWSTFMVDRQHRPLGEEITDPTAKDIILHWNQLLVDAETQNLRYPDILRFLSWEEFLRGQFQYQKFEILSNAQLRTQQRFVIEDLIQLVAKTLVFLDKYYSKNDVSTDYYPLAIYQLVAALRSLRLIYIVHKSTGMIAAFWSKGNPYSAGQRVRRWWYEIIRSINGFSTSVHAGEKFLIAALGELHPPVLQNPNDQRSGLKDSPVVATVKRRLSNWRGAKTGFYEGISGDAQDIYYITEAEKNARSPIIDVLFLSTKFVSTVAISWWVVAYELVSYFVGYKLPVTAFEYRRAARFPTATINLMSRIINALIAELSRKFSFEQIEKHLSTSTERFNFRTAVLAARDGDSIKEIIIVRTTDDKINIEIEKQVDELNDWLQINNFPLVKYVLGNSQLPDQMEGQIASSHVGPSVVLTFSEKGTPEEKLAALKTRLPVSIYGGPAVETIADSSHPDGISGIQHAILRASATLHEYKIRQKPVPGRKTSLAPVVLHVAATGGFDSNLRVQHADWDALKETEIDTVLILNVSPTTDEDLVEKEAALIAVNADGTARDIRTPLDRDWIGKGGRTYLVDGTGLAFTNEMRFEFKNEEASRRVTETYQKLKKYIEKEWPYNFGFRRYFLSMLILNKNYSGTALQQKEDGLKHGILTQLVSQLNEKKESVDEAALSAQIDDLFDIFNHDRSIRELVNRISIRVDIPAIGEGMTANLRIPTSRNKLLAAYKTIFVGDDSHSAGRTALAELWQHAMAVDDAQRGAGLAGLDTLIGTSLQKVDFSPFLEFSEEQLDANIERFYATTYWGILEEVLSDFQTKHPTIDAKKLTMRLLQVAAKKRLSKLGVEATDPRARVKSPDEWREVLLAALNNLPLPGATSSPTPTVVPPTSRTATDPNAFRPQTFYDVPSAVSRAALGPAGELAALHFPQEPLGFQFLRWLHQEIVHLFTLVRHRTPRAFSLAA